MSATPHDPHDQHARQDDQPEDQRQTEGRQAEGRQQDGGAGRGGPLAGVRVVEVAGIGPGPHACMILADLGADVVRLDRPRGQLFTGGSHDLLNRGRPSVAIDLKHPEASALVLRLVARADLLVEGMRPGVAERLGIGPADALAANPRLVYGRMTGWGQDGPLAQRAGHDLTYVALTGALDGAGQDPARPHFPRNLLGDFGGGSTYLVIGLLAALTHARATGRGQVVDAAIVDGLAHLDSMTHALANGGIDTAPRGQNLLDGGAPFYRLYETADGRHVAVGALEPPFFAALLDVLDVADECPDQADLARWPEMVALFARVIASRTRDEWAAAAADTDACLVPVLSREEAARHPHLAARGTFLPGPGGPQPAPAPRFSLTPAGLGSPPPATVGQDTGAALAAWGEEDVAGLLARGVVHQA
ncbi:CaiB/BaiF CoA-transferase family protein [Nocardioides sp. GY 10127]|uniref:CaiB/BaiF CoA transferase family protein n=1 Tax=Nocardioides sp. GY 10127 TaxID=2569762 RepID=UPI0010A7EB55|nr:CaiB/BaiF CoA-transferase family protein [Nocardioides sp. GY 10127]TIC82860.1 CoA transferase [Nocardioides sp. GY 10127]